MGFSGRGFTHGDEAIRADLCETKQSEEERRRNVVGQGGRGGCAHTRRELSQVPHYDRDSRAAKDVALKGGTRHLLRADGLEEGAPGKKLRPRLRNVPVPEPRARV